MKQLKRILMQLLLRWKVTQMAVGDLKLNHQRQLSEAVVVVAEDVEERAVEVEEVVGVVVGVAMRKMKGLMKIMSQVVAAGAALRALRAVVLANSSGLLLKLF